LISWFVAFGCTVWLTGFFTSTEFVFMYKLENVMKTSSDSDSVSSDEPLPAQTTRYSSADAYNYGTNVLYDSDPETQSPRTRHSSSGNSDSDGGKEIIHPRPVNMSFEEPL
jgi:hypothetical protein